MPEGLTRQGYNLLAFLAPVHVVCVLSIIIVALFRCPLASFLDFFWDRDNRIDMTSNLDIAT